jgi:trk system potassium uptake protein TrkA
LSIVIIGAGEMGYHLARRLSFEKRDVVLIDRSTERMNFVQDNLDVQTITGRGSSPTVLKRAGIAQGDILVAVTDSDEVNLVACFVAGVLNPTMKKIARLREEDYQSAPEVLDKQHLGIDLVISPEAEAVKKLIQVLKVPAATDVMDFAEGRVKLFGLQLRDNSPLVGQSLMRLRDEHPEDRILIPVIFREAEVIIPRGHDILQARDTVYVMAPQDSIPRVIEMTGHADKPLRSFMILGGSTVAVRTVTELEKQGFSHISIIESDPARCDTIACMVNHAMVLKSDYVDEEFLRSEGIAETDAFLALTDDDENNALNALLAKRLGAQRAVALTNKVEYHRLLGAIGVDVVINPRLAGASRILQYIRKGKVMSVSMLPGEGVEAIEFEATDQCQLVGKPLRKIKFPSGAILGGVERGREFFIPHGETVIQPQDRVVIFTRREAVPRVEKLMTTAARLF